MGRTLRTRVIGALGALASLAAGCGSSGGHLRDAGHGDAGQAGACTQADCANQPVPAIGCANGETVVTCTRGTDGQCHAQVTCVGATCGGIAGATCAKSQFCNVEAAAGGQGCDVADGQGVCEALPEVCPAIYSPVCGCDDKTYASACTAHAAGASVRHEGACTAQECQHIGGRPAYDTDGGSASCQAGEQSYPLASSTPGLCCLGGTASNLKWYTTCGDPVCSGPRPSDVTPCDMQKEGAACDAKGSECDLQNQCNQHLRCTDSDPTMQVGGCPISRAAFKRDIHYLSDAELADYHAQIMALGLARYAYKRDPSGQPRLGFIIEDVEPSEFVDEAQDRVDLYAYTSAVVAALKVQEKQIHALEEEVRALRAEHAAARRDRLRRTRGRDR